MVSSSGQVASGSLRLKTTVSSPFALTLFMLASSEEAPFGSAMSTLRSKEKTTSSAVRSEPSENFSPELSVHSKTVLSLVGEVAALRRVRYGLAAAGLDGQEVLVHRVDAVVGGQVVGAGRVVGDRLIRRATDDRSPGIAACRVAAAATGDDECDERGDSEYYEQTDLGHSADLPVSLPSIPGPSPGEPPPRSLSRERREWSADSGRRFDVTRLPGSDTSAGGPRDAAANRTPRRLLSSRRRPKSPPS